MTGEAGTELAIDINGLTYWYPVQDHQTALDHINLKIERGELTVLMGPTGGGKSTLALCLNGVIPRMLGGNLEGHVDIMGWSPNEKDIYEMATKIGLVFQDADSQICNIFVKDEVAFGAQNLLVEKGVVLSRVDRVLRFVGLENYEDRSVFALSGGEKQRLSIASVLAMEPKVILLDEPTANLDPEGATEVKALIHELKENQGVTIVIIEHNVSGILDLADRLVVISGGKIVLDGKPREVLNQSGRMIHHELGLRLPEATEFALAAEAKGYSFSPIPITSAELDLENLKFKPAAEISSKSPETLSSDSHNSKPIIHVSNLSFSYANSFQALKNVSLEIQKGEILAILGRNGSGKSTLTSHFIGLNRPTSGKVIVDGLDVSKATIKELARRVGYVFQYPEHQFVTDTVYDEMAFGLKGQNIVAEEIEQRTSEMLKRFSLDHVRERHPLSLSRGQKRRLSVASMLVMRPEIFILDEPTTGQDRRNINEVMQYLVKLNKAGLTVIIVTHDMELVAAYADRVVVLETGSVVYEGTPWQLFDERLSNQDMWGLSVPQGYRIYELAKAQCSWLPPELVPEKLAGYLEDREVK